MAKRAQRPEPEGQEPRPRIRPRHELLGVEAGKAGYNRGCRCDPCREWNAARMRDYRANKAKAKAGADVVPDDVPALTVTLSDAPPAILFEDLEPGKISAALAADMPRADGGYIFQSTVRAMAEQAALILDNADKLQRLDMVSQMQIRIMHALKRLEPPRTTGQHESKPDQFEQLLAAVLNGPADGK